MIELCEYILLHFCQYGAWDILYSIDTLLTIRASDLKIVYEKRFEQMCFELAISCLPLFICEHLKRAWLSQGTCLVQCYKTKTQKCVEGILSNKVICQTRQQAGSFAPSLESPLPQAPHASVATSTLSSLAFYPQLSTPLKNQKNNFSLCQFSGPVISSFENKLWSTSQAALAFYVSSESSSSQYIELNLINISRTPNFQALRFSISSSFRNADSRTRQAQLVNGVNVRRATS